MQGINAKLNNGENKMKYKVLSNDGMSLKPFELSEVVLTF